MWFKQTFKPDVVYECYAELIHLWCSCFSNFTKESLTNNLASFMYTHYFHKNKCASDLSKTNVDHKLCGHHITWSEEREQKSWLQSVLPDLTPSSDGRISSWRVFSSTTFSADELLASKRTAWEIFISKMFSLYIDLFSTDRRFSVLLLIKQLPWPR